MNEIPEAQKTAYLSHHLPYEHWMLFETLRKMCCPESQFHYNAYYESYVVHVRNLIDFLCTNPKEKQIRATHFGQQKRSKPPEIGRVYRELHDAVLHLGDTRPSASDQKITLGKCFTVFSWLNPTFEDFVKHLTLEWANHWKEVK